MRTVVVLSLIIALCLIPPSGAQQVHPSPPGLHEAEKQTNKPLEPPLTQKFGPLDPAQLKQEAEELAQLSAGVPADLSLVAKGQLPKDLADKLKRIEKLAKHLRNELSR